ncbi:MAG TPA: right-handed parallel beta-helix repeat-containing protein [Alkalispirochaeta sp.]|nr:right-handed parallel beta-helix repeat-containing protein [Alkalispirochaeta sp.]
MRRWSTQIFFTLVALLVMASCDNAVNPSPHDDPEVDDETEDDSGDLSTVLSECDGTVDNSALLQQMIDDTDHVIIPAGTAYTVGGVDIPSGKTISGPGVICKSDAAPYALRVTGSNVVVEDVVFQPMSVAGQPNCDIKLGDGARDVRIRDNHFMGKPETYSAICGADDSAVGGSEYTHRAQGVLITGNVFSQYVRPMFLHSVDNVTIQGNLIRDTTRDAIRLRENNGYVVINGNHFIEIGSDSSSVETQDAVDSFWSGTNLTISDNIVRGTESVGFDVKGVAPDGSPGSHHVIIANNQVSGTWYSAVVLHGDFDNDIANYSLLVDGNIFQGNSRAQVLGNSAIIVKGAARYVSISDNQIVSNTDRGITVQTRDGTFDQSVGGVVISGNTVVNNGISGEASSIGVNVSGVDGVILTDNMVAHDPSLPNPEQKFGIVMSPAETTATAVIRDNIVRCHASAQYSITGGVPATIESENIVTDSGAICS